MKWILIFFDYPISSKKQIGDYIHMIIFNMIDMQKSFFAEF